MNNPFNQPVRVPVAPGIQIELPLSRSSDHISSFVAADRPTELNKQRENVLRMLKIYTRHTGKEPTSKQIAVYFKQDRHMVARRLPDLVKLGMVEQIRPDKGECLWRVK